MLVPEVGAQPVTTVESRFLKHIRLCAWSCLAIPIVWSLLYLEPLSALAKHYASDVAHHLEGAERFIVLKQYDSAKRELVLALKQDPRCTDALNNMGVISLRLHQLDKAKDFFERALAIDPHLPMSLNNLAQVYYYLGSYDRAVATYKEALPYGHGRDCLLFSNLADALAAKGDYKEAGEYYRQALAVNANFPQALLGAAGLYLRTESYDLAYQYAVKALRQKRDWALAYYQLGRIESARGHNLEALKAYLLSLNYENNSDYARDTQALVSGLGIDPLSIERDDLLKYQASLTPSAGTQRSGLSEKISSMLQADSEASLERAQDYLKQRKWGEARRDLEAMLKQSQSSDPVLLNDLGLAYAGQKDYAAAQNFYQKAIKLSKGKCFSAYYNLGQLYRLKGDLLAAKNTLHQALSVARERKEECSLANNALGLVLKKMGDNNAALIAYKTAAAQAGPNLPVVHYNYAILLEKTDHAREAVNEYKLYLKLAPSGLNAEQVQARLRRLGVDS
jgi:tetratricopeptide (TPR) repeat protein